MEEPSSRSSKNQSLVIAALGVVFGDIGTSPLYALRECFAPERGVAASRDNVVGVVSILLWSVSLVVCVKYLLIVLRTDNKGEGGILALVTVASRLAAKDRKRTIALFGTLGIIGAALLLSDGMITPAISVLSAVEGLEVISGGFKPYIVPLSLLVLVALFPAQSRGTAKVGRVFGPVVTLWYVAMGILGAFAIVGDPGILAAANPLEAVRFFARNGALGFGLLGSVILALTGAEVLYADLGHFGRSPIKRAWFRLVYPALILTYLGQGAHLLGHPDEVGNLFFRLVPSWGLYPLVALATAATIIASQAVISGSFSLARQSVQLGFWPRIKILHTSDEMAGQVYVPSINKLLFIGTVSLVLGFRTSGRLGNAYGIAVSATMLMTTCVTIYAAAKSMKGKLWLILPIGLVFLIIDGAFFASSAAKVVSGGWIVVLFAVVIFAFMRTWMDGRSLFARRIKAYRIDPELFAASLELEPPRRVPGVAVFLTADPNGVPKALLHNLKHNKILHETTVVLSVRTLDQGRADEDSRVSVSGPSGGIWYVSLSFGFSETPDVPKALARAEIPGIDGALARAAYFVGRESIIVGRKPGMAHWRKRLFSFLFANATSPAQYFRLPIDQVVALGSQTEL
jgi:KUP system potassium uptake protein